MKTGLRRAIDEHTADLCIVERMSPQTGTVTFVDTPTSANASRAADIDAVLKPGGQSLRIADWPSQPSHSEGPAQPTTSVASEAQNSTTHRKRPHRFRRFGNPRDTRNRLDLSNRVRLGTVPSLCLTKLDSAPRCPKNNAALARLSTDHISRERWTGITGL